MLDAAEELDALEEPLGYRHVIVDEAQDMGPEALRLIRAIVPEGPNDLFFVGDGHQRIYRRRAVMGQCSIRIVGRSRKLKIIYRTTEEIRRFASAVLQGIAIDDLDGGDDTGPGYLSLTRGPVPVFVPAESESDEIHAIARRLRAIAEGGGELRDCCVMLRTVALRDRYFEALRAEGLDAVLLQRRADNPAVPGVRVATCTASRGSSSGTSSSRRCVTAWCRTAGRSRARRTGPSSATGIWPNGRWCTCARAGRSRV